MKRFVRRILGIPLLVLALVLACMSMLTRRARAIPVIVLVCIIAWPLLALAAGTPPSPDQDANAWMTALYTAFTSGEYKVAGGLIALGMVFVLRKFGPTWVKGKVAGYIVNAAISLLATMGAALAVDAPITSGTVFAALGTAASAMGLWELLKDTGVTSSVTPVPAPAPPAPPAA